MAVEKKIKAKAKPEKVKSVKMKAKPEKVKSGTQVIALSDMQKVANKKNKSAASAGVITEHVTSMYPLRGQNEKNIEDLGLSTYTETALQTYGSYVVEERAIADFRDGLKPVHRAILWSMDGLSLRSGAAFKKSARTVGDTIGQYHPHGDTAAYGAMVTIANTMPPAVAGQGNWGTPVDMAAAYRYTESRMSKFTDLFLLDSQYLDVVDYVSNFSNDKKIPIHLPALLPFMLFNGSVPAPAYGVKCGNPTFSFRSVSKIVIDMLNGAEYGAKKLAKTLKILHEYGCETLMSESDMVDFMATGRGKVAYQPLMDIDLKKKTIHIKSYVPNGFANTLAVSKTLEKLSQISGVGSTASKSGKRNPNAGEYGAAYEVRCKGAGEDRFYDIAQQVQKEVTKSVNYTLGISIRHPEKKNAFRYLSYVQFFKGWIAYRIKLELKLIHSLIVKAEKELHLNEVYLFAVDNMKQLLAVLPKVLVSDDPDKTLAKALKMPQEDAKIILDRQVRKLAKLERASLVEKINKLKAEIKSLNKDLKAPGARAAADTEQRVKKYLKSPDKHSYSQKPIVI